MHEGILFVRAKAQADDVRPGLDGRLEALGHRKCRCALELPVNIDRKNLHGCFLCVLQRRGQAAEDGLGHRCPVVHLVRPVSCLTGHRDFWQQEFPDTGAVPLDARVDQSNYNSVLVRSRGPEIERRGAEANRGKRVGGRDAKVAAHRGNTLVLLELGPGFLGELLVLKPESVNVEAFDFADDFRAEFFGKFHDVYSRAGLEGDDQLVGDFRPVLFFIRFRRPLGQAVGGDDPNHGPG